MTLYDSKRHEALMVAWYFELQKEPEEFANLFMEPLRNLTQLLWWAGNSVRLVFSVDNGGVWGAAWVEPCMSGAFFGCWLRADRRGAPSGFAFVRGAQRWALEHFPVLIGVTKQPRLEAVHLALGYEKLGTIPQLFDNTDAQVYILTKDGLAKHGRRRQNEYRDDESEQPLRSIAIRNRGEIRKGRAAPIRSRAKQRGASDSDGRGQLEHPVDKPRRGRKPHGRVPSNAIDAAIASASGSDGQPLRTGNSGEPGDEFLEQNS